MATREQPLPSKIMQMILSKYNNGTHNDSTLFLPMNESEEQNKQSQSVTVLLDVIYALDKFGVPTLLAIGVISNLILSITIRKTELKKVSAYCCFLAMGIVDTLYLIVMAIPWISIRVVDIYNTEGFCQLVYYLNLLTTFLSSWYLVLLLFERICTCYRPEWAHKYLNAFRLKCYITAFSIFSIVGHLYLTWTSGVFTFHNRKICNVIPEHAQDIMVMRKIDITLGFIVPVILSAAITLPLVIHICSTICKCTDGRLKVEIRMITVEVKINSAQRTRYTECPTNSRTDNTRNDKVRLRKMSQSRRLTLSSVIIAMIYIGLSLPHNVIKSRVMFMNGDQIVSFEDSLFLKLFEDLFKLYFACKAFVYFAFLPKMREQFIKVFFCKSKKKCAAKLIKKDMS